MNLQFISDSKGETTGVFIPIQEWNLLKKKYEGIEQEEINIPAWQQNEVNERMEEYKRDPSKGLDFDSAMDDIARHL